jgi:hypothetical protein
MEACSAFCLLSASAGTRSAPKMPIKNAYDLLVPLDLLFGG